MVHARHLLGRRPVTGAAGELRLEAITGNATGFTIVVDERLVIGRQSEGPGKLAEDPELSRHHAEIARGRTAVHDQDLSSTTARSSTAAARGARRVGVGDEIEIGETKLVVRAVPAAAAAPSRSTFALDVAAGVLPATPQPPVDPSRSRPDPEPAPVLVRLTVDFETEAARLAVESTGEPIRLELDDGQWRVATGGA